jgi:hypothetical protein
MKKLLIFTTIIFLSNTSINAKIEDCSKYNKLSKENLECLKNNIKEKDKELGVSKKVNKFKSSKTLIEFFKKKD